MCKKVVPELVGIVAGFITFLLVLWGTAESLGGLQGSLVILADYVLFIIVGALMSYGVFEWTTLLTKKLLKRK